MFPPIHCWATAIADLNEALLLKPNDSEAYAYRGIAYGQEKQFEKSIADFKTALKLNPNLVSAYFGLATIRATCPDASIRDGAEAIRAATKACELTDWKDSQNLDLIAMAYAENGNFDKAVEYEKQALKIGCRTAEAQNQMVLRLTLFEHSLKFQNPTIFQ